jgi:ubiquitin carboxyl-terminal hydrolase 4/11/15
VRDLWSGEYSVVTPGAFKTTVGEFAPQFSGYQQQDSQELMSCVLDGLHEDLNRVLSKPFVATVDSNGRADEVVSREAWSGHLRRNDSRVNDCCFGQMKSHLTCTGCGNTSVTFDPFSSLSLPVPVSTRRTLRLPLHLLTGAVRELVLSVDIAATIADVRAQIQAELQPGTCVHLCVLGRSNGHPRRVIRTLKDSEGLKAVFRSTLSDAVAAYELPEQAAIGDLSAGTVVQGTVDVVFGTRASSTYGMMSLHSSSTAQLSNSPRRVFLPGDKVSGRELYAAVETTVRACGVVPDFELYHCSHSFNSTTIKDPIPCDDNEQDATSTSFKDVICLWKGAPAAVTTSMDPFCCGVGEDQLTANVSALTLAHCLDKFSESEQLADEDTFFCGACKQHLAPIKKLDVWAAPDVLVVHLKRFQYSRSSFFVQREKIADMVSFPLTDLDMRPYVKGPVSEEAPPVYDLYAVSEHSGGLGGGHYTAKCRNFVDGQWYDLNDSSVSPTSADACLTPQAYVLFYRRKVGSLRWGGLEVNSAVSTLAEAKDADPLSGDDLSDRMDTTQ